MSRAEVSVWCPNCDDRSVEVADDGHSDPAFRDADRLTGTTAACRNCGDEFEVYYY